MSQMEVITTRRLSELLTLIVKAVSLLNIRQLEAFPMISEQRESLSLEIC